MQTKTQQPTSKPPPRPMQMKTQQQHTKPPPPMKKKKKSIKVGGVRSHNHIFTFPLDSFFFRGKVMLADFFNWYI